MPMLAIAAVAGAGAVGAGLITAATLSYVSIGLTVVGALTKSKELSQIGAGLGLGGGIASLFSGASGAVAGASEAVTGGIGAVPEAGFDAWAAGQGAAESAVGLAEFGGVAPSFETAGLAQAASAGLIGSAPAPITAQPPSFDAIGASAPAQPSAPSVTPSQPPVSTVSGAVSPPPDTTSFGIKNWWSGLTDAQKNSMLQVGGKAAEGLFAGWSAEQKNALERERFNLEQQKFATQNANANAQPVIAYKPVGLLGAR
jgi:hypothetical protein